ncbi:MAG: transcriptional regulator [Candidatus Odinarchaeum yellowstonii]|uniref:Putative HTH-type transcriptional regulatory protein OdinLCB4_002140 n=1 Tax=Odinarchaeota yellowstonii (strain LCB_4) TaxID=1841599 RepID=A0AAF0D317_ODILC|nr:MAG: transcriptional regulator [Candidatus Odinarchaeum yellowstonii]
METRVEELTQRTINLLKEKGYMVCQQLENKNFCFDIAARKNDVTFLIKVLIDIDNFQEVQANDLKIISKILFTKPFIMGERTRAGLMEDGVVYQRFNIPAINLRTLHHILKRNLWPLVYAKRGGFYVKLNFSALKQLREERQLSLKDIADLLGVSRKAVYEYERGSMDSTLETASKLEEAFGIPLALPIDIINWELGELPVFKKVFKSELQLIVESALNRLGLNTFQIHTAPFDILASYEIFKLLTSLEKSLSEKNEHAIQILSKLSKLVDSNFIIVVDDDKSSQCIEGVPVISSSELKKFSKASEFLKRVEELTDN